MLALNAVMAGNFDIKVISINEWILQYALRPSADILASSFKRLALRRLAVKLRSGTTNESSVFNAPPHTINTCHLGPSMNALKPNDSSRIVSLRQPHSH